MTENPVFIKEMRQGLFRRKPFFALVLWSLITGVLMWATQFAPPDYPFSILPMIALPLIVPGFAAGAFAKEYEQQTWQDLYLTRLTNLQVVWGKFLAALAMVMVMVMAVVPAMALMLIREQEGYVSNLGTWFVTLLLKLTLSASFYVLLAMVCSRYSTNRRTALTWCYVAMFLYAAAGLWIWATLGSMMDGSHSYSPRFHHYSGGEDSASTGFMGGIHFIFSVVVGIGTLVLLWVSLSEQRGYREGAKNDRGDQAPESKRLRPRRPYLASSSEE